MATHDGIANPVDHAGAARTEAAVQPLNRRRVLRVLGALAAAAAGAAAVSAARPETANAYVQTEPSTEFTGPIESTGGNSTFPLGATIIGTNPNSGVGVYGTTNAGGITAAVYGKSTGPDGTGVFGECNNAVAAVGVQGQSDTGTGVLGSGAQYGVWGQAQTPAALGVYGINFSSGTAILGQSGSGIGVQGTSASSSNTSPGVYGVNTGGGPAIVGQATGSGFGFSAVTQTGTGCFGGASGSGVGVYAYSVGGPALTAFAAGGSNLAGYISGPLYVTGSLTVLGAKSAAVKGADGSLRRMYSLESPESWFEDFGSGQLNGGSATIPLAPDFAGVVHGDNYHVFFTPRGEPKGLLYVSKQSPNSFTVQESGGGTSNIGFSYRIVAKRKDIPGARLEAVDEPPALEVPTFPTLPAVPPAVVVPRGHGSER